MWEAIKDYVANKDLSVDWGETNLAKIKAWVAAATVLGTTGVGSYAPEAGKWVAKLVGAALGVH